MSFFEVFKTTEHAYVRRKLYIHWYNQFFRKTKKLYRRSLGILLIDWSLNPLGFRIFTVLFILSKIHRQLFGSIAVDIDWIIDNFLIGLPAFIPIYYLYITQSFRNIMNQICHFSVWNHLGLQAKAFWFHISAGIFFLFWKLPVYFPHIAL